MSDPLGAVRAVSESLPDGTGLILIGGLAANAYRTIPRATLDADLLIVADLRSAGAIARRLLSKGFQPPPGRRVYRAGRFEWRRLLWPFPDHRDPAIVDLFFSDRDEASAEFIRAVVQRAGRTVVTGQVLRVATPEDIVVFKALAVASGLRGPKAATDEDDVAQFLGNRGLTLDLGYLRSAASSVGVLRAVNRWIRRSGR